MATKLVCIKRTGMHTAQFFTTARKLFNISKTYQGFELHRDELGETCMYKYAYVKDETIDESMHDLQNRYMEHIAKALKLQFKFEPWDDSPFPQYHFSQVDTTGFRKSDKVIVIDDVPYPPVVTVELRKAMLAYDVLFGKVNDAEYDGDFLAKMRGEAKTGAALAKAQLIAQEKKRLELVKEQKYAEIDAWYASEVKKLDDIRREKRRGICKKFNTQIDDARKMLKA